MPCDPILADALFSCASNVLDDTFCVYRGTLFATGDSFISDSVRAKGIFERFGAYIVDMEGAEVSDRFACSIKSRLALYELFRI